VGDFVLLRNNDKIPADLLIIATGEPDCTCYVETKNLDGETNLKIKRGLKELSHIKTPDDCRTIKCFIDAEAPNPNLYTFNGALNLMNQESQDKTIVPIGPLSLLLRGCMVRNTSWVIGLAIYTGNDTKLMQNSGPTPSKRSKIDRQINPQASNRRSNPRLF
jgi:phospholipid-translocating ATPase